MLFVTTVAAAADGPVAPYAGRRVTAVLEDLRAAGVDIAYSTNIVTDKLYVAFEPDPGTPLEIVQQILRPHGLVVREDAGVYIVVRDSPARPGAAEPAAHGQPMRADIETVVVAASRYAISRDVSASSFSLDQRTIQNMPDIGEDPIRVTQRLPGAAASGASARTHFRGGEDNEIGIMLNGQWLFDPFHVRDYQNVFSAIDARAIDGVEVYTGGFPVRYGDRMSGLVLMESLEPDRSPHHEIGVSVFNTSLLTAGAAGGRNWLFSARRGNLDLVIDPQYGKPSYFDVFGHYAWDVGSAARLSINALYAEDGVEIVVESDPAEREQLLSDTRNAQFWIGLDSDWSDTLESSTVLSFVDHTNRRRGATNDPEKMTATVRDDRDTRRVALQQDWVWRPSDTHRSQWGIHVAYGTADFDYDASAAYGGLQASFRDQPGAISRSLSAHPEGASYALYVSDRWKPAEHSTIEWGLRWDDQTYPAFGSDAQLSPRLSVLRRLSARTELRLSLGRYHQSQPIEALQIEDGITEFWPAQRADMLIAGLRHLAANDVALRVEAFRKDVHKVRPRFENLYDPLGVIPELQADRVRLEPSQALAYGIEISADRTAGDWEWWASYTWSRALDRFEGGDEPRSWDQRHAVQGGFGWRDEHWNFSAAASVHSGWPTTGLGLEEIGIDPDGEPVYEAVPGPRNGESLPTFASVDVRLSRSLPLSRGSLLLFVEISNLFDRRNVCCIDWDIGDDGLESSNDYWLPLLPAIGVLWEF